MDLGHYSSSLDRFVNVLLHILRRKLLDTCRHLTVSSYNVGSLLSILAFQYRDTSVKLCAFQLIKCKKYSVHGPATPDQFERYLSQERDGPASEILWDALPSQEGNTLATNATSRAVNSKKNLTLFFASTKSAVLSIPKNQQSSEAVVSYFYSNCALVFSPEHPFWFIMLF